ncbi:MAG: phosphotransferase [Nonomuraea sp.]|nr:phosphotransferase [Nonomuraea sp.]NUP68060.1 phosphotransferase [Nonomuraea sp.]
MRHDVTALVRQALGDPAAEIAEQRVEPVDCPVRALSTVGLHRVRGTTTSGASWSFFVKSVQSLRVWDGLAAFPEAMRPLMGELFPWRADVDAYLAGEPLPDGLRLPRLCRLDVLDDDRLVMWLEDVQEAPGAWDLDRYHRAARLLGELAAMRPASGTNLSLRTFATNVPPQVMIPAVMDDAVWRHPLVAPYADERLREDIAFLASRTGTILDALDRLPHTGVHGDASPHNLLVPADGSAEFVAVDWSWNSPGAAGFDLGQLLVGRAHDGTLPVADLAAVHEAITDGYGSVMKHDGYVGAMVLRSLWTAIPVQSLTDEPDDALRAFFAHRIAFARYLAAQGRALDL